MAMVERLWLQLEHPASKPSKNAWLPLSSPFVVAPPRLSPVCVVLSFSPNATAKQAEKTSIQLA